MYNIRKSSAHGLINLFVKMNENKKKVNIARFSTKKSQFLCQTQYSLHETRRNDIMSKKKMLEIHSNYLKNSRNLSENFQGKLPL